MESHIFTLTITALIGLTIACATLLRAWQGWLALKHRELELTHATRPGSLAPTSTMPRIEMADLKERIRKLEAIAAGIDV